MRFLLREESAGLRLDDSATPDDVAKWAEGGGFATGLPWLVPMDQATGHLPALAVPACLSKPAMNGARLPLSDIPGCGALAQGSNARLYLGEGLLGIYRLEGDTLACAVMLRA
jgi:hypothetical protein